jgi:hypothetical protein
VRILRVAFLTLVLAWFLALTLAVATTLSALADGYPAVPAGCQSGAWLVRYPGVEGHRWYDPLYPLSAPENHYGAGWQFDPCWPMFSTQNTYGGGWDQTSTP